MQTLKNKRERECYNLYAISVDMFNITRTFSATFLKI